MLLLRDARSCAPPKSPCLPLASSALIHCLGSALRGTCRSDGCNPPSALLLTQLGTSKNPCGTAFLCCMLLDTRVFIIATFINSRVQTVFIHDSDILLLRAEVVA